MRCAAACLVVLAVMPCHAAWVKMTSLSDAMRSASLNVTFTTGDFLEDGNHGWVAGHYRSEDGLRVAVFRTENGGRRWIGTYTDVAATPATAIDFVDADHGWLLASDSRIYRTDDAGRSWERESILGGTYCVLDLAMLGRDQGFASGSVWEAGTSAVFEYHADEREWQQVSTWAAGSLSALAARNVNRVWAAGLTAGDDYLARRRTGADRWQPMTIPSYVQALSFSSDSRGWAACTSGRIFATADGGETWIEQETPVFYDLQDILFPRGSAKGLAIAAETGAVLSTTDGGETWGVAAGPERASEILWDGGRFLIVARDGLYTSPTISRTLVPGLQRLEPRSGGVREILPMPGPFVAPWHRCRTIEDVRGSANMVAASFLDDGEHAWVLAEGRLLLRTRNGGVSWERLTVPRDVRTPQSVTFTDSRNGWLWGGDPCIWRTGNGGETWAVENVDGGWNANDFVSALGMFDASSGVAAVRFAGRPGRTDLLRRSPDTGVWTITEHSLPYPGSTRLAVLDPSCVWAMSSGQHGLRTQRFPEMERMSLGTERNYSVRAISFVDPVHGWVAAGTLAFRTEDGGRNWTGYVAPGGDPAHYPIDIRFDSPTHGYAITRLGWVIESEDGGESWRRRYEADRPNLISVHWFGRHNDTWWALAEDALYTNAPEPGPAPTLRPPDGAGRALARALLVWAEVTGWADNGVNPNRGIAGREALFGVRWDARNAEPPADLRLLIRPPGGATQELHLRPLDYFSAQERPGGSDWGVAYTPPVAGEYAYRFVGSDTAGNACHGEPNAGAVWNVE